MSTTIFGSCFSSSDPFPSDAAWRAIRACLGASKSICRLTAVLFKIFPMRGVVRWDLLDPLIDGIESAGMDILINPCGCPAWASEGQPAFEDALTADSWWNRPHAPRPATPADPPWIIRDGMVLDPFPHGLHRFDQNPERTDTARDLVTGEIILGTELAAIDAEQPPRPWINNPPHRDPQFAFMVGVEFAKRYGRRIKLWSIENEPGSFGNPVMHLDSIAFDGPLGDTIKDRYMPEIASPFFRGVFSVLPDAQTLAIDADSDAVAERILIAESELAPTDSDPKPYLLFNKAFGAHPYGDVDANLGYATTEKFVDVHQRLAPTLELWCSEIDNGPNGRLVDWIPVHAAKYRAVIMGTPRAFMSGWPNRLDVSDDGKALVRAIESVAGKFDPIKTTMPVKRRRSVAK